MEEKEVEEEWEEEKEEAEEESGLWYWEECCGWSRLTLSQYSWVWG